MSTKAFDTTYRIDFNPYQLHISNKGLKATVLKNLDYGTEQFAVLQLLNEEVIMKVDEPISGDIFVEIDLDAVGITEVGLEIRLV